jgi:hypothetical protein
MGSLRIKWTLFIERKILSSCLNTINRKKLSKIGVLNQTSLIKINTKGLIKGRT